MPVFNHNKLLWWISNVDTQNEEKDPVSKMYNRPSLLKKRRQTKQARFVIMDTLAHVGLIITILCLIYIYQDYSIFRTYQGHQGMFFKSFHKMVSYFNSQV